MVPMKEHPFKEFEIARLRFGAELLRALSPLYRTLRFRKTADGMNRWADEMVERANRHESGGGEGG